MAFQKEYIFATERYEDKQSGKPKTNWFRIGEILSFGDKKLVKLYQNPGVTFPVYKADRKGNAGLEF